MPGMELFSRHVQGFFGAVRAMREPNGRGDFCIRMTAPHTYSISASYCNYEDMNCERRLYGGGYLSAFYPVLKLGGVGDLLLYEFSGYDLDTDPSGAGYAAMQAMRQALGISGHIIAQRDDWFSFDFQT